MRALILAVSSAAIVTLGASSVYANGPLASPYEVWYPSQVDPAPAPEGRASYTEDQNGAVAPQRHHTRRHHPVPAVDVVQ